MAAVVAVAGARQGVWPCTQDGTQLGGRGRVPAPSPVTRQLPPDTFRPLLCECVCQALSLLVLSGPQPLPPRHRNFIPCLLATNLQHSCRPFAASFCPPGAATRVPPSRPVLSSFIKRFRDPCSVVSLLREHPELHRS